MTSGAAGRHVAHGTPSAVLARLLASLAGVFDGDEPVDELSHALQCADLACRAGARPALVAAALLHDVGRSPLVAHAFPALGHEHAGADYLRPLLGDEVAWLVRHHVAAKAWLVEHETGYGERLSPQSAASHTRQVDALGTLPVGHPLWRDAVALRRLDDAAKEPEAPRPELARILAVVAPLLRPAACKGSPRRARAVEEGSGGLPTITADGRERRPERPSGATRHLEV